MPPRKKVSKDDIIDASFNIVRECGIDALNARIIAKNLNCSVQPIFSNFNNMEELKKEVFDYCYKFYILHLSNINNDEKDYKKIGKNFIHFAVEEPNLYKLLFTSPVRENVNNFMENDEIYDVVLKSIARNNDYTLEEMKSLHLKMWIFTQGIASLSATKTVCFEEDEIDELLTEEYIALRELKSFKDKNNIKNMKDLEDMEMK